MFVGKKSEKEEKYFLLRLLLLILLPSVFRKHRPKVGFQEHQSAPHVRHNVYC